MINYIWRLLATGFCFAMFSFGGLLVSIFVCPLQVLCYRDKLIRKQKALKMVHYLFRMFVWLLQASGAAKFFVEEREKKALAALNGHIIMANHPSLIDVVVLISLVPNADCVVKASLFRNPFIRSVLKNTDYIRNDTVEGLIDGCNRSLSQGNNIIIFPEGTRTEPKQKLKFQRGAANIALRCNVPITTVLIEVEPTTLTKADKWYNIPHKRVEFTLKLAKKQPFFERETGLAMSKMSRQLTTVLEQHFTEELENI